MQEDSIFTKIIKGEIPSHKVYEDDKTFAFLDIHPIQPGHVLVIPKSQVEFVWDLGPEDYEAVMATTQKIARHMREVLDAPYVGLKVIGVDVPHAHVQLIPFHDSKELQGIPDMDAEPDHDALAVVASALAF